MTSRDILKHIVERIIEDAQQAVADFKLKESSGVGSTFECGKVLAYNEVLITIQTDIGTLLASMEDGEMEDVLEEFGLNCDIEVEYGLIERKNWYATNKQ